MIQTASTHVPVQKVHEHQASPLQLQNIYRTLITQVVTQYDVERILSYLVLKNQ